MASCIRGRRFSGQRLLQPQCIDPQIKIGGRAYWPFPGRASAGPGTRCSVADVADVADVDGAVALVGASRTVGVVRDDGCAHLVEALELVGGEFDGCGAEVDRKS